MYPVIAAFRANIDPKAWAAGKIGWLADPFDVLRQTTEEMCSVIKQEHADNKDKPAEVGRKEAAYRMLWDRPNGARRARRDLTTTPFRKANRRLFRVGQYDK